MKRLPANRSKKTKPNRSPPLWRTIERALLATAKLIAAIAKLVGAFARLIGALAALLWALGYVG